MVEKPPSTMRSLERSLDVLDVLSRAGSPLRLSDVAERTGLTLPTASRILLTLQDKGFVAAEDRRFRVGPAVLAAAHAFLVNDRLVQTARPVLQQLASTTRLTASVYERVGWERVLVARVDGEWPLRYELPIGRRLPLHLGAGKALSVDLDAQGLEELAAHVAVHPDGSGAGVDEVRFVADLDALRAVGYHVSVSERAVGVASLSVPVRDRSGALLAGLSVSGPSEQNSRDRLRELAPEVLRAAAAIGEARS